MPTKARRRKPTPPDKRGVRHADHYEPRAFDDISPNVPYTYAEVAGFMQTSEASVRKLVAQRRLGYTKLNEKTWRILGRQLIEFLERNAERPERL